jgi:hypothetical protein
MSATTNARAVDQEKVRATLTSPLPRGCSRWLADPTTHSAIDGTGRVQESVDRTPLTEVGQIFRMDLQRANRPNGDYQVVDKVEVLDPPRAIGWLTGVRRLDPALRPCAARSVRDRGHAHLRRVGGAAVHSGVPPIPAVRP